MKFQSILPKTKDRLCKFFRYLNRWHMPYIFIYNILAFFMSNSIVNFSSIFYIDNFILHSMIDENRTRNLIGSLSLNIWISFFRVTLNQNYVKPKPLQNNSFTTSFLLNIDQFLHLMVLARTKNFEQSTWKNQYFFPRQPFMKSSHGKLQRLPLLFCILHLLVFHPKIYSLILYYFFHGTVAWNHSTWN